MLATAFVVFCFTVGLINLLLPTVNGKLEERRLKKELMELYAGETGKK